MTIISTSIDNSNGDGFDFSSNYQVCIVDGGVDVISETGYGVYLNNSHDVLENDGNIGAGKYQAITDSVGTNQIVNGTLGTLFASTGIAIFAGDDYIANYGHIDASINGVYLQDANNTFVNNGLVSGAASGVATASASALSVFNTGTIVGQVGLLLTMAGSVASIVDNTGVIRGSDESIHANGTGTIDFKNIGSLIGDVYLDNTVDNFVNRGSIFGNVTFATNGANTFDGRGGAVSGTIIGGAGADTIWLGNGDATVDGGGGHDLIHAGAGEDTFLVESGSPSDTFHIYGFNAAKDKIDFSIADFPILAGGSTFFIGSAANSLSDHLFYNPHNGWLYFDADGSGTKDKPIEIANLGTAGAGLTVRNFDFV